MPTPYNMEINQLWANVSLSSSVPPRPVTWMGATFQQQDTRTPPNDRFVIEDEDASLFYERVYSGGYFPVGSAHVHSQYVRTPEQYQPGDAGRLARVYARAGITPSRMYEAPPIVWYDDDPSSTPISRPRHRALPRDAVEPLPLPG